MIRGPAASGRRILRRLMVTIAMAMIYGTRRQRSRDYRMLMKPSRLDNTIEGRPAGLRCHDIE